MSCAFLSETLSASDVYVKIISLGMAFLQKSNYYPCKFFLVICVKIGDEVFCNFTISFIPEKGLFSPILFCIGRIPKIS